MSFWIITAAMGLSVALILGLVIVRSRTGQGAAADYDLRVYRDQLKEVDRDLARGVINEGDAERTRVEISRRILAADTAAQGEASKEGPHGITQTGVALGLGLALMSGAFALYQTLGAPGYGDLALGDRVETAETLRRDRPSQEQAENSLPAAPALQELSPDYVALVEQLRSTVAGRPDDLQGHRLLAQSEGRLGNFSAAYKAQQRVISLLGDEARAQDYADYADMLILAAGGYVSPEAEAALQATLQRESDNGPARYYTGLMMSQTGRPDVTFRIWEDLLSSSPPDASWVPPIRAQIEEIAFRAGVNYTLPPEGTAPTRGPSAGDIEAASSMTPAERMEMIEGMVGGLSDRLATEGGPPSDWARLISALVVLGRANQAIAIHDNALQVFAGNETALDIINRAAEDAGIIQ
jgi:cytochrome c-type biogenesis protein CcmH